MSEGPSRRELRLMRAMREGHDLREEIKSGRAVATLGNLREVELSVVEQIEAAGWIYQVGTTGKERVWALTMDGLKVLVLQR